MPNPGDALYWMQYDARQRGDVLIPDRWVELIRNEMSVVKWSILFLPIWIIVGFMVALAPLIMKKD